MDAWVYWLLIVLILSFVEVITINLVTIWFVFGGLIALGLSFVIDSFYIQFMIFGISGLVIMLFTRPLLNKLLKKEKEATNLDRVIGMTGVVTEEISKNKVGEVKVDGKKWSATSSVKILEGEEVEIVAIDGVKLKVKKGN